MAERKYFGKLKDAIEPPPMIEAQTQSYEEFLQANVATTRRKNVGLQTVFKEVFPIASYDGQATLDFVDLGPGTFSVVAAYTGDAMYDTSTSGAVVQTILANAPTASMSFTPSTVGPGGVSRLVVAATNNTPKGMYGVALGVVLTMNFTLVKQPVGGSCRRSTNVLYCLFSLPKGATKQLVLDMTAPTTPGQYTMNGYARNIDTMDETAASATLTVQ